MMTSKYNRLNRNDFNVSCEKLANILLGKLLVRQLSNGKKLVTRICETECYLGGEDKASHSYDGKRTPRNEPMFMLPGTAYVYMTYGMYHCFNISSKEPGAAVLIRAVIPILGLEEITNFRAVKRKSTKRFKETDLCNGPSKLCMSLDIRKENCNKIDLTDSDKLWVETDPNFKEIITVVKTSRIGIESAGEEWAKKPLRYYILGCPYVSKRDKQAETGISS